MLSTNDLYATAAYEGAATRWEISRDRGRRTRFSLGASVSIVCLLMLATASYGLLRLKSSIGQAAIPPVEVNNAATSWSSATSASSAWSSSASSSTTWTIEGALTEACTCKVPCTCNFGEGPSPHRYCYAFYAYDIRKGKFGDVVLDGLRFGATELKGGRTYFIDERANDRQREALRVILARVIRRLAAAEADEKAKADDPKMRYTSIKQEYDDRRNRLEVAGVGEFAADYIMGLDKKSPVIVRNNTTWQIYDAIKAKTTRFRVKVGSDSIDTKDTNSNQGDFSYNNNTDFGSARYESCGSGIMPSMRGSKDDPMCGTGKSG